MASSYLRAVASHDLNVFLKDLESDKYTLPVLERVWELTYTTIFLITDVDGVLTDGSSLPAQYFNHLFRKLRYAQYASKIEEYDKQIDLFEDGRPFEGIARCLFNAGLTLEDHLEACDVAGKETPITPYTHEAIGSLYDIPPFIGLGFNSASFTDSLTSFSQYKRLPVSLIKGSWLDFHKDKFTGRHFFNYGSNKFASGTEMLTQMNCIQDLRIKKSKLDIVTLSDTRVPDIHFRKFVGLGGMSMWMDKSIQRGLLTYPSPVLEVNIPESLNDMRIFAHPVKYLYRAKVITLLGSPEELKAASKVVKGVVGVGQRCIGISNEEIFNSEVRNFVTFSQKALAVLSKFDFPRYSTGIDFKYLELLSHKDMQRRKEIISEILDIYLNNFPEALSEEDWLTKLD